MGCNKKRLGEDRPTAVPEALHGNEERSGDEERTQMSWEISEKLLWAGQLEGTLLQTCALI
jgi:hypothetical protein